MTEGAGLNKQHLKELAANVGKFPICDHGTTSIRKQLGNGREQRQGIYFC